MASSSPATQVYGFVLVPEFALMSFSAATEPLRAANLLARKPLYAVLPLSIGGEPVASSAGFALPCGDLSKQGPSCHTVFIVAGGNPPDWREASAAFPVLRRLARRGVRIGGISSGSYLLAEAGLLHGRDFSIHWEHAPALREAFPHLTPRQARYVLDGDRITCGGGVAPLDMMHALVAERMGQAFARRVSDWFLHTAVADPGAPQRGSEAERFGTHHPALLSVLEKMETAVERPLSRQAMARLVGLSTRQLDRLFSGHLGSGFLDTYRRLRLDHARKLIGQSPMSIAEIAYATGFSSTSHFSRAFRAHFGMAPRQLRARGVLD
jgi:transcriptional regulator GlxA family with amidase domain